MVVPSGDLTYIFVGNAPLFFNFKYWVFYSPNMTSPKSIIGSSTSINAFLHVHIRGISIYPVSERIGNTELMSSLIYGVNVMVIVVERPADILPDGVYTMWKKSFILSSSGRSLNELNENETFVKRMVWVCDTPTVKSCKIIRRVSKYVMCLISYLEDYLVWFGDECSAFELTTSNNLRFHNSFFLSYASFCHVLLL